MKWWFLLLVAWLGVDSVAPYLGVPVPEVVRAWTRWLVVVCVTVTVALDYLDLRSKVSSLEGESSALAEKVKALESRLSTLEE